MKTSNQIKLTFGYVRNELRRHAPFTLAGTLSGICIMVGYILNEVSPEIGKTLFWTFHPVHVFLSAMATASMCRFYGRRKLFAIILVGYFGSIGIATLQTGTHPALTASPIAYQLVNAAEIAIGEIRKRKGA